MYVVRSRRIATTARRWSGGYCCALVLRHPAPSAARAELPGRRPGALPETEKAAADNLALPMWAGISEEQQERVAEAVRSVAGVPA
jgi:dTDP-4-amino-4,6-dideoxygalactose transaminase